MKVAILWYALTGYLNACLKALAEYPNLELFVVHKRAHSQAPYETNQFDWIGNQFYWKTNAELIELPAKLERFNPDAIVSVGWNVPEYREIAKIYADKSIRIITMDNNWRNTPRQWLGILIAPLHLRRMADAMWVPGERQATFATKLGFAQDRILRGLYSCDRNAFAAEYEHRVENDLPLPRCFLFVGRFVKEKGLQILVDAYVQYRKKTSEPWPLICCGSGPLQHLLENQQGIMIEGFVQPANLPKTFARAGCLLLPSTFEPWGLVVHEAVSAGLIVLASSRVGATAHLVQYNYNGFVFDPGSSESLAGNMMRLSTMDNSKLERMSSASFALSQQFTPELWSDSLIRFIERSIVDETFVTKH